jgi:hypothetical protein
MSDLKKTDGSNTPIIQKTVWQGSFLIRDDVALGECCQLSGGDWIARPYGKPGRHFKSRRSGRAYVMKVVEMPRAEAAPRRAGLGSPVNMRLFNALRELVAGLDATYWSIWQSTAKFSKEWKAAEEALSFYGQHDGEGR